MNEVLYNAHVLWYFCAFNIIMKINLHTERGDGTRSASTGSEAIVESNQNKKKGMILPFEPHSITFDDIKYSVDMPQVTENVKQLITFLGS